MSVPIPQPPLVLDDETLRQLRAETELYAAYWVDLCRWRGEYGGVLADGHDPASIASDAWFQVFPPTNHTNGALPSQSLEEIRHQLRRQVRREINRLHHRKENRCVRNEPDLAPVFVAGVRTAYFKQSALTLFPHRNHRAPSFAKTFSCGSRPI
jgi:hypothetical protein